MGAPGGGLSPILGGSRRRSISHPLVAPGGGNHPSLGGAGGGSRGRLQGEAPRGGPRLALKRHLIAIQDIYPIFGVVFLHFLPFQVIEFVAYFTFFFISLIPVLPLPRYLSVKLSKQHQSESTHSLFLMPIFIVPASVSVSLIVLV